jgi:hypothetical protein
MEWTTSPSFKERLSVGFSHQQPTPDDGFASPIAAAAALDSSPVSVNAERGFFLLGRNSYLPEKEVNYLLDFFLGQVYGGGI